MQYTWSVPQDLAALASLMGGDAAAASKLTTFFTSLNASRYAPYDWSGNEPSEWAPWEFDSFGAPDQTQGAVRSIVNAEYADAPVDEPGNDDLGAISSWYVWAALGFFPVTPGSANLALASPLFPSVTVMLPDGRRLVEHAPGAAATRPFVHALTVAGVPQPAPAPGGTGCAASSTPRPSAGSQPWGRPWLPASVLRTGATLSYTLASSPDPTWASSSSDSPPSYGTGQLPAVGFSLPSGAHVGDHRADHDCRDRCGPGGGGTDHGPLAGGTASERARGLSIVGNAGARAELRVPAPRDPVTDRDGHHHRVLLASGRDDHCRGRGAASGRARCRGAVVKTACTDHGPARASEGAQNYAPGVGPGPS